MTEHRQKLLIVENNLGLQDQLKYSYEGFDVFAPPVVKKRSPYCAK